MSFTVLSHPPALGFWISWCLRLHLTLSQRVVPRHGLPENHRTSSQKSWRRRRTLPPPMSASPSQTNACQVSVHVFEQGVYAQSKEHHAHRQPLTNGGSNWNWSYGLSLNLNWGDGVCTHTFYAVYEPIIQPTTLQYCEQVLVEYGVKRHLEIQWKHAHKWLCHFRLGNCLPRRRDGLWNGITRDAAELNGLQLFGQQWAKPMRKNSS